MGRSSSTQSRSWCLVLTAGPLSLSLFNIINYHAVWADFKTKLFKLQGVLYWLGRIFLWYNRSRNRQYGYNCQEIDGIISTRLATENDASRRLKSEFLIQFDGLSSNQDELVIVIEQSILLTIQIKEQCAFTICCHKTEAEPCHILEY